MHTCILLVKTKSLVFLVELNMHISLTYQFHSQVNTAYRIQPDVCVHQIYVNTKIFFVELFIAT